MLAQQAAAEKLKQIMSGLQIQDLQNKIASFGQPQSAGISQTPGGGVAGYTFNPKTGTFGAQDLQSAPPPAIDKEAFRTQMLTRANAPDATPSRSASIQA